MFVLHGAQIGAAWGACFGTETARPDQTGLLLLAKKYHQHACPQRKGARLSAEQRWP